MVASSGKGNFIVGDYTEGGANEILAAEEDGFSSSFSNVFLVEGDDVVITMGLHIKLYKSKD